VKKSISWNPTEMIPKVKKFTEMIPKGKNSTKWFRRWKHQSPEIPSLWKVAWNSSEVRKNAYPPKGLRSYLHLRSSWSLSPFETTWRSILLFTLFPGDEAQHHLRHRRSTKQKPYFVFGPEGHFVLDTEGGLHLDYIQLRRLLTLWSRVRAPRWAPNCWCNSGPTGTAIPQYSSPPKGQGTEGPLEELLIPPHCLVYCYCNYLFYLFYYKAASKETTVTWYLGILFSFNASPSITMIPLYIGMGVDGDFPPSP
jgi:hypothetical protein